MRVSNKNILMGLVGLLLLWTTAAADVVYIRNQRLAVQQVDGARVVHLDAFRALLTPEEDRSLEADERSLRINSPQGESRTYSLTPYGELEQWEDALEWLGYRRRESSGTGVVDWVNSSAGAANAASESWKEPTAETLAARKEASLRRSGYRSAEKNYNLVMKSLGSGGTEQQRQWVRRLGYQVAEQSPLKDLHWTFDVAATPIPNALCTGEGFVVVTEGLLALNLTDDEMAGVLGHEVAHGVRRHAQIFEERYTEARRLSTELRQLERDAAKAEEENDNHRLQTIRSRLTSMTPRFQFLADFVKNQQAYDQHEEEEADVQGMHYAAAAGFDPYGEGRALIKLRARSVELFGQAYQEGSRTHPPLKRRLEIHMLVQQRWQSERNRPPSR
jgi:hypothetical protein